MTAFDEGEAHMREMAMKAYLHASHFDGNVAAEYAAALGHGDMLTFLTNRPTADQFMFLFDDANIESWRKSRAAEKEKAA
jgi:hypothetical protein